MCSKSNSTKIWITDQKMQEKSKMSIFSVTNESISGMFWFLTFSGHMQTSHSAKNQEK